MKYQTHRHRHRILGLVAVLVVLALAVGAWRLFITKGGQVESVEEQEAGQITGRPSPRFVSSRTLTFGGLYLGGKVDESAKKSTQRTTFPFKSLETFNRNGYDAWLSGVECSIAENATETGNRVCDKSYLDNMKEWFDVSFLGNDYTDDLGVDGFNMTKEYLSGTSIQHLGSFDPNSLGDMCDIVSLPARYTLNDSSFKEANMPIALCSVNLNGTIPKDLFIDTIQKYSEILPTWVYAHNSSETTELDSLSHRSFVDAGASVVLGNHPAMPLVESYKGKLIVHSLGSFIGTGEGGRLGLGLSMEIEAKLDQSVLLWTRLAPECSTLGDSCIETAAYQGLVLPKYSYKFDVMALQVNDDLTIEKGSEQATETLKNMIGWAETTESLAY